MKSYEHAKIAIDAVIFTISNGKLMVFLEKREKNPFKDKKELPGGLLLENETAEETLSRKIKEIIGIDKIFFKQFFTFTDPKRDPRARTITIGYIALVNSNQIKDFLNWYNCDGLDSLAFDHKQIIETARDYLKKELNSELIKNFMPDHFPLNRLAEVYEVLEEKNYDNRNFRRMMIRGGIVAETKLVEKEVSHRPAKLYRFC